MSEVIPKIFAAVVIVVCFFMTYADGKKNGFDSGSEYGYLLAIEDICNGHLKIVGDKLIFDCHSAGLLCNQKTGEVLFEINMSDFELIKEK